jgi:hypothetical protein
MGVVYLDFRSFICTFEQAGITDGGVGEGEGFPLS